MNYEAELHKPFIDLLKDQEEYSIRMLSEGCFHRSDEKLVIQRKKDKYYLIVGKDKRLLNDAEMKAIREFELELNYMNSFGCTTTDTYTVKYQEKEMTIRDGSCLWHGSYHLKQKLHLPNR